MQTSHRHASCHTRTLHSTGERHTSQDTEQDCEMGETAYGSGRERIEYEADPPHAELIIHQLGLSCSSRSVSTWSENPKVGVDLGTVLNNADHTLCRATTIRLCYLALDRPHLQLPSKELARWMQAPTVGNQEALKRVFRYLIGHGQLIQEFVRQVAEPFQDVVFTD